MKLQISELAKQTGVSVRTLHYYDTIGLLKPTGIDPANGYRYYDEASLETLKDILHYRELNFALKDIPKLMEEKEFTRKQKLLVQRRALQEKKKQLDRLLASIDTDLSKVTNIHPWFDKILQDYNYSGFAYKSEKEEESFCSWGMADYENNKPFSLSNRFPIAMLSSDFIIFCTLLFEEKGLLNTEEPIGTYVPECRYGDTVKIQNLLDMTSGFSDELAEKWRAGQIACTEEVYYKKKTLETLLEIIHYAPLKFTPGTKFDPCGLNYEMLGIILERISGAPLDTLLQYYIFEPLGMTNTSYNGTADITGYTVISPQKPIVWDYNNNTSWGLLSTAEDLKRWFDALQDRKLLSEQGYKKLFAQDNEEFACGMYKSRSPYRSGGDRTGISYDITFDFEKDTFYLTVRNKAPLPDNHDRLMYFTIPGCDNGWIKLEAWEMDTDTFVKITSIKIYEKDAKELYSFVTPASSNKYLLYVENHGEKRHACEFIEDDSYYLTLDFAEVLGNNFDPAATYILEVRAECDSPKASQIGTKYLRNNEEQCMGYYIFFNEIQPYELFMEALGNVMEVV